MCTLKESYMVRKDDEKIPVEKVLDAMTRTLEGKADRGGKFIFRGEKYKYSDRMRCFLKKGTNCIYCGRKGLYFILEKNRVSETYHLALYGLTRRGKEVLMTMDHIVPLSKGGGNTLENEAPCCYECNQLKGAL